jgi:hypothetical protein
MQEKEGSTGSAMNVAPLEAHYWDLMELFIMKKVSLLC